jgi:ketosteroid isomerase-like protein
VPASAADVEHVRETYRVFAERGADFERAGLEAFFERFYDPGAVIENVDSFPAPARHEGLEGYRRWYEESYGPYEDVSFDVFGIDPVGEHVVVRARVSGRPRGEAIVLEVQLGVAYTVRAGRIAHVRVYLSHERALEAAAATV